jgi:hypothetical protein
MLNGVLGISNLAPEFRNALASTRLESILFILFEFREFVLPLF